MGIAKPAFCLLIVMTLGGCTGLRVSQDYEPGTDFSAYGTFAWKSADQPQSGDLRMDNPLVDGRIRQSVERTLTANGYRKIDQAAADFLVEYALTVQPKIYSPSLSIGTGFGIRSGGTFGGISVGTPLGDSYDETVLVIDLYDAKTGRLIWRGSGAGALDWQSGPAKNTEQINALVNKVLEQFPPPR